MKKVFVVFLVFAALGAVAVWQWNEASKNGREVLYHQAIAEVRERAVRNLALVSTQDENAGNETSAWLTTYFRELAGVRARREFKDFPSFFAQDGRIKELDAGREAGLIAKAKYDSDKEFYDFTKRVFDVMAQGKYQPEVVMRKDSFRLDLFNLRKEKVGGNETLLADFAIWNYPGELNYGPWSSVVCLGPNTLAEGQAATEKFEAWKKEAIEIVKSHIVEAEDFAKAEASARREPYVPKESIHIDAFGGEIKLPLDEEAFAKELCIRGGRRQIDADSTEPYLLVERPSRQVPDFPPGVVVGTYQLPLVPAHTKYMTMQMNFGIRTPNGTPVDIPLSVERWKLDETWMMDGGRDWTDAKVAD